MVGSAVRGRGAGGFWGGLGEPKAEEQDSTKALEVGSRVLIGFREGSGIQTPAL